MIKSTERRQLQLQGPRPAPLMISRNSSKIKKPSSSSELRVRNQKRAPVIVYLKSPKIIHVRPEEFMGLVQRLTGKQAEEVPTSASSSSAPPEGDDATKRHSLSDKGNNQYKFGSELLNSHPNVCLNYLHSDWPEFQ